METKWKLKKTNKQVIGVMLKWKISRSKQKKKKTFCNILHITKGIFTFYYSVVIIWV